VGFHVFAEVIGTHESLVADRAGEPLLARVGPQVALEFVGAGEPLAAEKPIADERALARVPAQMGLQVGRLAVDFAAAGDVATVDVALAQMSASRAQTIRLLAVGAVASGPSRVAAR